MKKALLIFMLLLCLGGLYFFPHRDCTHPITKSCVVGEFRRAYNKTNSIKKSALDSRDITVDFSRGGVTGKEINKYVAFLNANIQGLDKTVRSFKDRPFATSMKVLAMLTLPSILLRLLQDPDDMDKIAQWEKDTYWVFYVNGVPIKIPKQCL